MEFHITSITLLECKCNRFQNSLTYRLQVYLATDIASIKSEMKRTTTASCYTPSLTYWLEEVLATGLENTSQVEQVQMSNPVADPIRSELEAVYCTCSKH